MHSFNDGGNTETTKRPLKDSEWAELFEEYENINGEILDTSDIRITVEQVRMYSDEECLHPCEDIFTYNIVAPSWDMCRQVREALVNITIGYEDFPANITREYRMFREYEDKGQKYYYFIVRGPVIERLDIQWIIDDLTQKVVNPIKKWAASQGFESFSVEIVDDLIRLGDDFVLEASFSNEEDITLFSVRYP